MFVALLYCYSGWSQTTFNKRFELGFHSWISNVWETPYGYMGAGLITDLEPYFHAKLCLSGYDWQGNLLYEKQYGDTSDIMLCNPDPNGKINDSTYVLAIERGVNGIAHCGLIWINEQGDTLQTRNYPSPYLPDDPEDFSNWMVPTYLVVDDEGNIYVSCAIAKPVTANDFCILKILPNGELDWTYTYSTQDDPDLCLALKWAEDYLLVGMGGAQDGLVLSRILQIDNNGNLLSDEFTENGDVNFGYPKELEQDSNGQIFMITESVNPNGSGICPTLVSLVFEDDEVLWTAPFGNEYYQEQRGECLVKSLDGKFVALGVQYEELEEDTLNGIFNWNAWLVKCDAEGAFEWQRFYHYVESTFDQHKVYDLKATSDGGYIFCGEATDLCYTKECNVSQQGWLVKVDEYGCLVPGCQTGILEINQTANFIVGPNPANDFLNIYLETVPGIEGAFSMYDIEGKLVRSFAANQSEVTYIVDVHDMEIGVYILSFTSEKGVRINEKVLIGAR